jgi:hypothetical protein
MIRHASSVLAALQERHGCHLLNACDFWDESCIDPVPALVFINALPPVKCTFTMKIEQRFLAFNFR